MVLDLFLGPKSKRGSEMSDDRVLSSRARGLRFILEPRTFPRSDKAMLSSFAQARLGVRRREELGLVLCTKRKNQD